MCLRGTLLGNSWPKRRHPPRGQRGESTGRRLLLFPLLSLESSGGPVMGGPPSLATRVTGQMQGQLLTLLQAETSALGSSWLQQMKALVWPGRMWTISVRSLPAGACCRNFCGCGICKGLTRRLTASIRAKTCARLCSGPSSGVAAQGPGAGSVACSPTTPGHGAASGAPGPGLAGLVSSGPFTFSTWPCRAGQALARSLCEALRAGPVAEQPAWGRGGDAVPVRPSQGAHPTPDTWDG